MLKEYRKEEMRLPWDVDTLSKDGFSKSVVNIKPIANETDEDEADKQKTFVERHGKQIKHFGMMQRWDDSQKFLSDNPHLVCEETATHLVSMCIDLEVKEKHALMEQVAHQTIVMQFILELARTLKADPRGCFRQIFSKLKTAEKPYQDAFQEELESLKGCVQECAQSRIESAMEESEEEEEERQEKLGTGGLNPVAVYESLPKDMQRGFDEKNTQVLQDALSKLAPLEANYHMMRCVESGLWVLDSGRDSGKDDEDADEEVEGEGKSCE